MSWKDHVADDIPFQLIRFVHKRESTSKELFLSNILLIYVQNKYQKIKLGIAFRPEMDRQAKSVYSVIICIIKLMDIFVNNPMQVTFQIFILSHSKLSWYVCSNLQKI